MVYMKFMSNLAGIIVLAGRNSGTLFNIIQDNSIYFCRVFCEFSPILSLFLHNPGFFAHVVYLFVNTRCRTNMGT